MGLFADVVGVWLLLCFAGVCYMLVARLGPFAKGSVLSSRLGLDGTVAAAALTGTAAGGSATSTSGSGGGAASSISSGISTLTAPTATYAVVNSVDMPEDTMWPDPSSPVTSTPTYGATGCQQICSSNSKCLAAVYDSKAKACYMKSVVEKSGSGFTTDASKTLMFRLTPLPTGTFLSNTAIGGAYGMFTINTPATGDCISLCQGLPACQGVTHDNASGSCNLLVPALPVGGFDPAQNRASATLDSWTKD